MKLKQIYEFYSWLKAKYPHRIQTLQDFYFACYIPTGLVFLVSVAALQWMVDLRSDALFTMLISMCVTLSLGLWLLGAHRTIAYLIYHTSLLGLIFFTAYEGNGLLSPSLPWLTMVAIQPYFIVSRSLSHGLMALSSVCILVLYVMQSQGLLPHALPFETATLAMAMWAYFGIHLAQGFVAFVYDLFYIHQLKHIQLRNSELQQLTHKLQSANSHKDRFLTMISHDMRTPLNGVMGYLSLIHAQPELSPETQQYVHQANTSSQHLLAVINDLLDLSQSSVGNLAIHPSVVNLPNTLNWVFETVMPQARESGLDYRLDIQNDLPTWVRMDGNRFAQILINLLGNAVKFTRKGSVTLVVTTQALVDRPTQISFQAQVIDTGMGIPADALQSIFEPFVQVQVQEDDTHYLKPHTGNGLGLTISRDLARAMGGDIKAQSVLGQGSTFWVELVLELAHPPKRSSELADHNASHNQQLVRLLVVDDNPVNRKVLITTLKQNYLKAHIDEADNGLAAIHLLTLHAYDAVILDLVMPDLDGTEVVRHLRSQLPEPQRSVPVLGLTANLAADALKACKDAGMDEVMGKPFDRPQLLRTLHKWFDAREGQ